MWKKLQKEKLTTQPSLSLQVFVQFENFSCPISRVQLNDGTWNAFVEEDLRAIAIQSKRIQSIPNSFGFYLSHSWSDGKWRVKAGNAPKEMVDGRVVCLWFVWRKWPSLRRLNAYGSCLWAISRFCLSINAYVTRNSTYLFICRPINGLNV